MATRIMIFAAALMPLALQAQQSGGPLPPDDPRLYQLFFHFQDRISSAIQSRTLLNPQNATKEEKSFAGKLRIKHEELSNTTAIARGFVADLAKWESDLKAHVESARSQNRQPESAALLQFDQRKRQLIDAAILRMSTTLSPASWVGLRSYINNEYRRHTRVMEFK